MKNDVQAAPEQALDIDRRTVDAKLANVHARIQRNKADLERTNAELTLKITEMLKRLGSGK